MCSFVRHTQQKREIIFGSLVREGLGKLEYAAPTSLIAMQPSS